jgi:hypothetical protein
MEKRVEISDYEQKQHQFMLALGLVGISVDYITADIIYSITLKLKEKGSKMDIMDIVQLRAEHDKKWDNYFEQKKLRNEFISKKVKVEEVVNNNSYCPIPLDVLPDKMGINLVSVDSVEWTEQNDGQLVDLTIKFNPTTNEIENSNKSE